MTGLDKIIDQIQAEAKNSANQIIAGAEQTARELSEQAGREGETQMQTIKEQSRINLENYHERVKSAADFKRRTALLAAKQEIISEMLEQAYQTLDQKEDAEYFAFIVKMIEKAALPKQGEIYFSQRDLDRLPKDFPTIIATAAAENKGQLELMKEPKDIDNGFILVYGGIEENCTFRALFEARKEQLQDKANAAVFS